MAKMILATVSDGLTWVFAICSSIGERAKPERQACSRRYFADDNVSLKLLSIQYTMIGTKLQSWETC